MTKKVVPYFISTAIAISILSCSLSFQPDRGEPEITAIVTIPTPAESEGNTPTSSPFPPPTQTVSLLMPSATKMESATVTQPATISPTQTLLTPTLTVPATTAASPTDSYSGAAAGYHLVKIHNRYPFTIYVYLDGRYLMEIPTMKYMTYNGVRSGTHTFSFAKRHKKHPVSILTERIIDVTGFTEIWVSP